LRRHRTVAAAPERSASESWGVVAELVVATLERSPIIDRADVEAELSIAAGVGRALIAGGHLDASPLVVRAGKLDLAIKTASGDAAFSITENLSPVPGGADAHEWTVYLPAVPPLVESVTSVAADGAHLSADDPDELTEASSASARESLDAAAVQRWADEQS
jgi:hypothetical protein